MNDLGVHALVWVGGWSPREARQAILSSAKAGFDLIEVPVLDPSAIDAPLTRDLLAENGLQAGCSLGLTPDADISSEHSAVVTRGQELLQAALDVAIGLGASYLGGVLYSALAKYPAPPTKTGRRNAIESLGALAERAAPHGIRLGLEIVNRYESNLVNTTQDALELIAAIGAPNVYVHLDTYHMNIEEPDFFSPVLACGDRLGYVHVGESNRGYLGTGTVDFEQFFTALRAVDYSGPVTFESFSSAVVHPTLSNTLAVWRNLWSDGGDLATQARTFIRRGLEDPASVRR